MTWTGTALVLMPACPSASSTRPCLPWCQTMIRRWWWTLQAHWTWAFPLPPTRGSPSSPPPSLPSPPPPLLHCRYLRWLLKWSDLFFYPWLRPAWLPPSSSCECLLALWVWPSGGEVWPEPHWETVLSCCGLEGFLSDKQLFRLSGESRIIRSPSDQDVHCEVVSLPVKTDFRS